jgi:hypothetical protein
MPDIGVEVKRQRTDVAALIIEETTYLCALAEGGDLPTLPGEDEPSICAFLLGYK